MFPNRPIVAIFAALLFLAASAMAQKNEISGLAGRTFIPTQTITGATFFNPNVHFGNGLSFEGNYSRHLMGEGFLALRFEVPVVFNPDEDLNTGANLIPEGYSSFFVAPSLRVNVFSDTAFSPWVSLGGGYGRFGVSDKLLFGGKNPGSSGGTGLLQMGIGLDVKIRGPWGIRLATRDFWSGRPPLNVETNRSRQHNFFVGGGVTYRF
jgi:hypothetical protein